MVLVARALDVVAVDLSYIEVEVESIISEDVDLLLSLMEEYESFLEDELLLSVDLLSYAELDELP